MIRLITSDVDIRRDGEILISSGPELRHLKVVRVEEGEKVQILDGEGKIYEGYFLCFEGTNMARVRIICEKKVQRRGRKVILACSLVSANRFDEVVEKVAEFGVDVLIPMICERTVVRPTKFAKMHQRWMRKVVQVCRQTGMPFFPKIDSICDFKFVVENVSSDVEFAFIPCLERASVNFFEEIVSLRASNTSNGNVLVLIGPEGDFSPAEIDFAMEKGVVAVSLGQMVLRVESAAGFCAGLLSQLRSYEIIGD